MTQPGTFNDLSTALRMREVVAKLVREEMNRQRPPARYGQVINFNRFTMSAAVRFPGDVETTTVKFPPYLQPVKSVDLGFEDSPDVARVEGVPGNLWITDIVNGPAQQDGTRLNNPRLMGGQFMHTQQASFFSLGTSELPPEGEAWNFGRWKNDTSFASDGLVTLDVVVQQSLFCSIMKHYSLSIRSDDTAGVWEKVAPSRDSGPWSGNDFELEIMTTGSTIELRVRRTGWSTGGFTPGGYDLSVWFHGQEWERDFTLPEFGASEPAPDRMVGTTSAEGKGPFVSPALAAPRHAQHLLQGGGAVTFTTGFGPILKWTARFMVIGLGRSHLNPGGFFSIPVPVGGVTIPVYSKAGATSATTQGGGVFLNDWESLYYELPWGGPSTGIEANFRIVHYDGGNFQVPSHWVHVATKLADTGFGHVVLGNGDVIDVAHNLSLQANWAAQGFPWATPAWRAMQGNRVELEGLVKTTVARAADVTIATLPAHYKPSSPRVFSARTDSGIGGIVVTETGIIRNSAALNANQWISLDGISFPRGS